jgi:hypothetical protein
MTKPSYINSEGASASLQSYNGTLLSQCPVFLVQGMPFDTVSGILTPGYTWQVCAHIHMHIQAYIHMHRRFCIHT